MSKRDESRSGVDLAHIQEPAVDRLKQSKRSYTIRLLCDSVQDDHCTSCITVGYTKKSSVKRVADTAQPLAVAHPLSRSCDTVQHLSSS